MTLQSSRIFWILVMVSSLTTTVLESSTWVINDNVEADPGDLKDGEDEDVDEGVLIPIWTCNNLLPDFMTSFLGASFVGAAL